MQEVFEIPPLGRIEVWRGIAVEDLEADGQIGLLIGAKNWKHMQFL